MLLRDSILRSKCRNGKDVCALRFSRTCATQPFHLSRPTAISSASTRQLSEPHRVRRHIPCSTLAKTQSRHATGAAPGATISPSNGPNLQHSGIHFSNSQDVREYLRKWSREHQQSIRDNAPNSVQLERSAALPNSLFIRNNDAEKAEDEDYAEINIDDTGSGMQQDQADEAGDFSVTTNREMRPGDAVRMTAPNRRLRPQLAIYLGTRGVQSLYLLSDGRWYADCQHLFYGHIVSGLATQEELSRIESHLPQKQIEYQKVEEGGTVPFTAFGEIPHADSQPILNKLAALNEETEEARREYTNVYDQIYDKGSHDSEFTFEAFEVLLRKHCGIEFDTVSEGAKMFLLSGAALDERLIPMLERGTTMIGLLPRRMQRTLAQVTEWARSYQDAAARAATGKSVVEDLQKNPLTNFISKARRLVSKSRKIRLPTLEGELGPTVEELRPAPGTMERRHSGEDFTTDEKAIIEFLWLSFVRRPAAHNIGTRRSISVASMIVRAVGAYPKFVLNSVTGTLFLKELGCMDPWAMLTDHFVHIPHHRMGLHHHARELKETADAALSALKMQPGQEELPLPDTLAHLRKDWGDLEVLCVDSLSTRIVDDGISVEPSDEFAEHYWIHVHISHLSAFIPHDHPLLARGRLLGGSIYHTFGVEPYIPFEVVQTCSLKPNKPVLTFSTLLSPDGSVKDVRVTPGIVRNVIRIDSAFMERYSVKGPINTLAVGGGISRSSDTNSEKNQERMRSFQQHQPTFDRLQDLLLKRWEARTREDPESLRMLKLPISVPSVRVEPFEQLGRDTYERLFRSEHVVGDPSIRVRCQLSDYDRVSYQDQSIKYNPVAGAMMLASESAATWTVKNQVPVIYRYTRFALNYSLSRLNSLGPHDSYVSPAGGESVEMSKHLLLNMAGYAHVTSPLRRYRDLINHYQIDAYLKAQGPDSKQLSRSPPPVPYPRSKEELWTSLRETSDGALIMAFTRSERFHWIFAALYRAFYFHEAKLPETWDVLVENPVALSGAIDDQATTTKGVLTAIGAKVVFIQSERGWEKMAKFRQYVPSKIIAIEPRKGLIQCQAVGPPADRPHVADFAYPELQADVKW